MNENLETSCDRTGYRSFLLRLWKSDQIWHASLQDPLSRCRYGFSTLEELFAFLMQIDVSGGERQIDSNGNGAARTED